MVKLTAIGHLGKDCVVNNVNGKSVINFSVAHSEKYKDAQGVSHDKTLWIDCAYWVDRTGIAPYLKQGTMVYVEGMPDVRLYQNKEGRYGATLSLRVISVQLLGGNKDNQNNQSHQSSQSNQQPQYQNSNDITEPSDDLPF